MIGSDQPLPSACALMHVARCYAPKRSSDDDPTVMKRIDAIHLAQLFLGSRRIVDALADDGIVVIRKRIQRLMRTIRILALYPRAKTGPHRDIASIRT